MVLTMLTEPIRLKGHKLSLVYFSYGSVNLYCTNNVLKNNGRVQINPTVRVPWYSHGKHIIDLHQFADVFVPSFLKSEIKSVHAKLLTVIRFFFCLNKKDFPLGCTE